ncbi:MAG TPA: HPP family protein [Candidatus Avidesulfovibrio excrementigallinarum]|nr:HPP family protein [Candidatus Avidesulfovibrio excrementigallinarum]
MYRITFWNRYLEKMRGLPRKTRPNVREASATFGCAFIVVWVMATLVEHFVDDWTGVMLIPSFGASCIVVFGTPESQYAQPRNVILGHMISALAGVLSYQFAGCTPFGAALAVGLAGAAMHLAASVHPPGGATALLAVIGDAGLHGQGLGYVFMPVGTGATLIVVLGIILNNLCLHRRYPTHWL